METTLGRILERKGSVTAEERKVIGKALTPYRYVTSQYEKYVEDTMGRISAQKYGKAAASTLDSLNPFSAMADDGYGRLPTDDEIRTFACTSWAEAVSNALTPLYADGTTRRRIRKKAFSDVKRGKYVDSDVRKEMDALISRLSAAVR